MSYASFALEDKRPEIDLGSPFCSRHGCTELGMAPCLVQDMLADSEHFFRDNCLKSTIQIVSPTNKRSFRRMKLYPVKLGAELLQIQCQQTPVPNKNPRAVLRANYLNIL